MQLSIYSTSVKQTQLIAEQIGSLLKGGEVIELSSDLGGGKTTFVHGLVKGIKSNDKVASPTFTISRVYKGPKFKINHFDFYRLEDLGLMAHELQDIINDDKSVTIIEWAKVIQHVLPKKRLRIEFHRTNDEERKIIIEYPKDMSYLMSKYVDTNN